MVKKFSKPELFPNKQTRSSIYVVTEAQTPYLWKRTTFAAKLGLGFDLSNIQGTYTRNSRIL